MLTATNLSKTFGSQILFKDANLQLNAGARYGIVGANGSGKSTLLKILTGQVEASTGMVQVPKKARVGTLSQDHYQYEDTPIIEVVMMGHKELWDAIVEKDELLAKADQGFDMDRYAELEDIVIRYDGYSLEARAAEVLAGLNIPTRVHKDPLRILSGGFKLRALLGQVLASEPDLLLLDEPTNHLDILSIAWLEQFLLKYKGCAAVVSHDHKFLNTVCTHIIDVDYERVTLYTGNYEAFEAAKEEERDRKEGEIAKRKKEIDDHKSFIDRFKAKASKARQAQSKMKQMSKIVIEDLPESSRRYPNFRFVQRRPSGREACEVKGIWKSYGDQLVLGDVGFRVMRGDRLAIIGPNGIGKSTLLKIMMGKLEADSGEVVWGFETYPGYFPQDHKDALSDPSHTLQSWLWEKAPTQPIGFVRGKLAEVLFGPDDVDKKLPNLSGGEGARLVFAGIGVDKPNVLVLDEPTNHLDMEGIEALAEALLEFDGTILFVSHDRWFVSQVATRIIEITEDGVEDFPGTYDEFMAKVATADHLDRQQVVEAARKQKKKA
ncbi:MAG: ABC-F family ATP-binding cassette domain-containing protein [Myxococcales bacterium]|nr:ABC-F family ATP-binding cassette domain-containing protein [Myxococcales bacterium]MCB9731758.1 ABC-F family ATP-binding cassette domain-containing protein [Deltaproteobacteria bacterium]